MFAVDDLDDTLARLRERGAQLVDEVVQYKDVYRLCSLRGPRAYSSGWPSKSADAKRALGRHSGTLAQSSARGLSRDYPMMNAATIATPRLSRLERDPDTRATLQADGVGRAAGVGCADVAD